MLTNAFYVALMSALRGHGDGAAFAIAVGAGEARWDQGQPGEHRGVTRLVAEVARKVVAAERVVWLNPDGQPTATPAPRLECSVTFGAGEAVGVLRECGLFAVNGGAEAEAHTLLSYFAHPRIDKAASMTLARVFRIDLTPRPIVPGTRATRYLGNTSTTEVHDLDAVTPGCQIAEIRFDRRYYFGTLEAAVAAGYDLCAYCFGRHRSAR